MFRIVPILFFLLIAVPFQALAQGNPAYTVNDVKVDILAETAVIARNQAFAAAQAQAFKMLASRFASAEETASMTPPDAATIAGMVSDFEITSEQLSRRRYLGTYVFRFKTGPVNRYFGHGPVGNYDAPVTVAGKLLVLPFFSQNGQTSLWNLKQNPWLEAWQKQNAGDSAFLVPQGDVSDTMDIRVTEADKITQNALKRLRARYNVNDVALVSAIFDQKGVNLLAVSLYRTDRGRVEFVQSVPVEKGQAKRLGELLAGAVPQIKTILNGNWKGQSGYDPYAVVTSSATPASPPAPTAPAESYTPQAGRIRATTRFATINEWLTIRRALNGIPPLKSIQVESLTTNQTSMVFTYSDWMALTSALSARSLFLQPLGPGEYNLVKVTNATTGYNR